MNKKYVGIHKWMPLSKYHGGPGVSNSILTLIGTRSPLHARYAMEHPSPSTEAQRGGECFHTLTLESEFFRDRFYIFQGELRLNDKKKEWADAEEAGLIVVREIQLENVKGMVEAVRSHSDAGALLDKMGAEFEHSYYWIDKQTGLLCKVRPDIKINRPDLKLIVDLKSCRAGANKDEYSWVRQIVDYRYHVQAGYYLEGVSKTEGIDYLGFCWITVESEPPYGVNIFMADKNMLDIGRAIFRRDLNTYAECVKLNMWPGYEEGIKTVSLPEWYEK